MSEVSIFESSLIKRHSVDDLEILCSAQGHRRAVLYFHGFPGPAVPLPPGGKRIIDDLYPEFYGSYDFYYPLYTQPVGREFSFEGSIAHASKAYQYCRSQSHQYETVTVVGQSFGAMLAAEVAQRNGDAKIILLTPFLGVSNEEVLLKLVRSFHLAYPSFVTEALVQPYFEQLKRLSHTINMQMAFQGVRDLTILAAENDEIIPLKAIEVLAQKLPNAKFKVLEGQTHALENRELVKTQIRKWI